MIYRHQLNSIDTAAKTNRLATIAIAAQRTAYKRTGGKVEHLGVTESHTFDFKKQHQMAAMSGKVTE